MRNDELSWFRKAQLLSAVRNKIYRNYLLIVILQMLIEHDVMLIIATFNFILVFSLDFIDSD